MSVKVMGLVWDHFPGCGGQRLLALALADEADHDGGDVFPSIPRLAARTKQDVRTVQRQIRKFEEQGWLQCVDRSSGGRNRPSRYRINQQWMTDPETFAWSANNPGILPGFKNEKPRRNSVTVSKPETPANDAKNPGTIVSPACTRSKPLNPPLSPHFESGGTEAVEDRRLAAWMLERIRQMHPKHRDPPWKRWCRDIRIMRERDKRTRREIAELFAWANADGFWQSNILSPAKLREKWDQLEIRRGAPASGQGKPAATDRSCATVTDGGRCGKPGIRSDGNHANAPWHCAPHWEQIERERAGCST